MNQKIIILSLFICLFSVQLVAQDLSIRFKAGLSYSLLLGDKEQVNGMDVEDVSLTNGFHVGLGLGYPLSDRFGLRAMLLYSQRGLEYKYDGSSYFVFDQINGDVLLSLGGNRKTTLEVTNSYLEIPITAYARLGRVELEGGFYAAVLVSSRGSGELTYSNTSANLDPVSIALDYNYYSDSYNRPTDVDVFNRTVNGIQGTVPQTIGAYYESIDNDERRFNLFDFGLTASVAFYLNQGLYLGVGVDYGLLDATNNNQDISAVSLDPDRNFILREDTDQNVTLKASVGFNF